MRRCHYDLRWIDVIMTLNGEVSLGDQMGGGVIMRLDGEVSF